MTTHELRQKFLEFYESKGHSIIPSASLIPENDPTVLFTTAGMHPLVPYLLGETHPGGTRVASAQKCIRTGDIDEVGDNRHLTFFEMLGNWSFGDYFKKDAINWSFEFLTSSDYLKLNPRRLYVSVFEGDADAPADEESVDYWKQAFLIQGMQVEVGDWTAGMKADEHIFSYPKSKNWWGPAGESGPCGPDTEMFYDTLGLPNPSTHAGTWAAAGPCHPNCDCGRYVEIWNDVFMQYFKKADGTFESLKQKNVDTGMGLERTVAVLNGTDVYGTDSFTPIISRIEGLSGLIYNSSEDTARAMRIVADHLRAATFIMGDERGVVPSNVGHGYVLRRLIRRAIRYGKTIGIDKHLVVPVAESVIENFREVYPELEKNSEAIKRELKAEEEKFGAALEKGLKVLRGDIIKISNTTELGDNMRVPDLSTIDGHPGGLPGASSRFITGRWLFDFYQSFGFPLEMSLEELKLRGISFNDFDTKKITTEFYDEVKKHQNLSRTASAGMFKGGLADHSEDVIKMHTATHLLHQALRDVLGSHVEQKGSNITKERLRFDFSHPLKMTAEEVIRVEQIVNDHINKDMPVHFELLTTDEAKKRGAIGLFDDKYANLGNKVKVYFIGDYSKEICGGPHVEHTGQIGGFKIQKEEAVAAGVRRIKALVG